MTSSASVRQASTTRTQTLRPSPVAVRPRQLVLGQLSRPLALRGLAVLASLTQVKATQAVSATPTTLTPIRQRPGWSAYPVQFSIQPKCTATTSAVSASPTLSTVQLPASAVMIDMMLTLAILSTASFATQLAEPAMERRRANACPALILRRL